jgi:hypothetical protein
LKLMKQGGIKAIHFFTQLKWGRALFLWEREREGKALLKRHWCLYFSKNLKPVLTRIITRVQILGFQKRWFQDQEFKSNFLSFLNILVSIPQKPNLEPEPYNLQITWICQHSYIPYITSGTISDSYKAGIASGDITLLICFFNTNILIPVLYTQVAAPYEPVTTPVQTVDLFAFSYLVSVNKSYITMIAATFFF